MLFTKNVAKLQNAGRMEERDGKNIYPPNINQKKTGI